MAKINRNKERPGTPGISAILEKTASNTASGNGTSVYDTKIGREMKEILNVDDKPTEFIHRDLIYPNPLNIPYMEGITENEFEALKFSFLDVGQLHNLVVLNDGKGRYRLISGEKRWTATTRMTEEEYNRTFPKGLEAKIYPYNPDLTEDNEHILLLTCNVLTFSAGSPDPKQLRNLIRLYIKKGYERKDLVEYLNIYLKNNSATLYKRIAEANAIDEFFDLLNKNILTRSALQRLGDLPEDEQRQIYQMILNSGMEKIDEDTARTLKKNLKDSKKDSAKAKSSGSVSFIKFDKSYKSAAADLVKLQKLNLDNMDHMELTLAKANLDLMNKTIKELRDKLEDALKKQAK